MKTNRTTIDRDRPTGAGHKIIRGFEVSGVLVLLLSAILNMAGFISGLDFFALFLGSLLLLMIGRVLREEGSEPTGHRRAKKDAYSV